MRSRLKFYYTRANTWCARNPFGFGIIVLLVSLAPIFLKAVKSVKFNWKAIANVFLFSINVPLYAIALVIMTFFIVSSLIRKKFIKKGFSKFDIAGLWRNDWGGDSPGSGSEYLEITKDLEYYVNGDHYFNLVDFSYDKATNKVEFSKVAVKPEDHRRVKDVLTVENNFLLVGTENGYPIKYTKLT